MPETYTAALTANGSLVTLQGTFALIGGETPTHITVADSPVSAYNGTFELAIFTLTMATYAATGTSGGPVGVSAQFSVVVPAAPAVVAPSFLETLAGYGTNNIADLDEIIADRLYPVEAPQGVALPFGVFTQISGAEDIHHGGKSGWGSMRVQYEFYSTKFHEVHDAARALRAEFEGRSTTLATGVTVCYCRVESEYDDYDSGERIYSRSIDLLFEYKITT